MSIAYTCHKKYKNALIFTNNPYVKVVMFDNFRKDLEPLTQGDAKSKIRKSTEWNRTQALFGAAIRSSY